MSLRAEDDVIKLIASNTDKRRGELQKENENKSNAINSIASKLGPTWRAL